MKQGRTDLKRARAGEEQRHILWDMLAPAEGFNPVESTDENSDSGIGSMERKEQHPEPGGTGGTTRGRGTGGTTRGR